MPSSRAIDLIMGTRGVMHQANELRDRSTKVLTHSTLTPVLVHAEHSNISTVGRVLVHALLAYDDPNWCGRICRNCLEHGVSERGARPISKRERIPRKRVAAYQKDG